MARIIHIPLSGGDRKSQPKAMRDALGLASVRESPTPAIRKTLEHAYLHGALIERDGKIYSPASEDKPVCSKATVLAMVDRGWLKPWRSRYEITREGKRAEHELDGRL